MKTIIDPYYGLKCHPDFKLLAEGYLAITLFGHIFFRMDEDDFEKYLETNSGKITMHHEFIHILLAKSFKTKYLGFYLVYLFYWIKNIFKFGNSNSKAYYNIPFEREAYMKEKDFSYNETNWKSYKEGPVLCAESQVKKKTEDKV